MDKVSPFLISEDDGTLRIAWDNRRVRKANFVLGIFILFWIVFTPITLLTTYGMFLPGIDVLARIFCVFWSTIGWVFIIAVPYGIIARTWSEWIEISTETMSYGCIGFLARKPKKFPIDTIIEIGCGLRGYGSQEPESMVTLNVMRSGGILGNPRRQMFGYWLATKLKVQVFETIEEFVTRNQIPLKMTRYSPLFGKAERLSDEGVERRPIPAMSESAPIEVTEDDETLKVQWDNRRVRKIDSVFVFYVVFWMFWAPATVMATYAIFHPPIRIVSVVFFTAWSVFGWAVTLGIPYQVLQRYWSDCIELTREAITHVRTGFLSGKPKTFPLDTIYELGISSKNPTVWLTISYGRPSRRRTYSFGYWLVPEVKEQIFQTIEDFVARK
jgi:hypothetical protein